LKKQSELEAISGGVDQSIDIPVWLVVIFFIAAPLLAKIGS
jgi:hypothetical protein